MDYSEWDKQEWFLPTQAAYLWCGIPPLSKEERRCIDDVIEAMSIAIEDDRLYAYTEDPNHPGKLVQGKFSKDCADGVLQGKLNKDCLDGLLLSRKDLVAWSKLDKYPTPFLDRKLRKAMRPPKECADRISDLETELKQCRKESKQWQSAKKRLADQAANDSARISALLELNDAYKRSTSDLRNSIERLQRENEQVPAEVEDSGNRVKELDATIIDLRVQIARLQEKNAELQFNNDRLTAENDKLAAKASNQGKHFCEMRLKILKGTLFSLHHFIGEYRSLAKGRTEGISCTALASLINNHRHHLDLPDEEEDNKESKKAKKNTGASYSTILDLIREAVKPNEAPEQTPADSAIHAPANNQEQGTPDTREAPESVDTDVTDLL